MIVKRVIDLDDVKEIILNPDILSKLEDDDNKIDDLLTKDCKYVGCYVDNKIVGLAMFEWVGRLYYVHITMLKGYRGLIAMKFAKEAIKFREINTVYTNVDESFKHIIRFAKDFGFKLHKTIKGAIKRNGVKLDMYIYKIYLGDT